ncbi:glycine-rich selenoprotein-like [Anopheles arabiensis]|uniref:AGAP000358-PA n=3 Tax=gambiae species complex TaxID=44542 RepID=A0NCD9_ANOGA|nr:glycine-rich selenoprotein [Anopheles gambiae]XP_040173866.1 glycine-rich selenoprotein-like [Anopheles arabiensis]XP_040233921.1 glycine-rich selenoprotein-like [Anopheles coluzzii]XP_041771034.1 glycine-rich selenoprotein-like [Anopheles merus]EAU77280.3 AGAP000358-PA [Anopheles gambiae str. PEST]
MVYISRNGAVQEAQPWGVDRIKGLIMGFFNFLVMFFRTMLDFQGGGGSGGRDTTRGYGGSGGGGGGGPPGGGPRRRPIGRPMTLSDCTIPGGG